MSFQDKLMAKLSETKTEFVSSGGKLLDSKTGLVLGQPEVLDVRWWLHKNTDGTYDKDLLESVSVDSMVRSLSEYKTVMIGKVVEFENSDTLIYVVPFMVVEQ